MQQQTIKGCLNNSKNSYSIAEKGEMVFTKTKQNKTKLKRKQNNRIMAEK